MTTLALILAASVLFVATNIDDLLLLIAIHSDHRRQYPGLAVLLGQVIGFSAIVGISLLGFWFHVLIPSAWLACLGFLPLILGLRQLMALIQTRRLNPASDEPHGYFGNPEQSSLPLASWRRTSGKVAALTLANGSDNISVYLPTFSSFKSGDLLLTLGTFYVALVLLWFLSIWLASHPRLLALIRQRGPLFSPLVLIALGLWLIKDSVLLTALQ